ncbi:hypothetical protein M8R20_06995 [Pseudomonas sp. R2.Fl]|nr:hypothetical protein [Pseudomonas sp. R2.Fl]
MSNDFVSANLGSVATPRLHEISPSLVAYAVPDNSDAPAFREGEYVVADPADRKPVNGSIVLVEWSSGRRSLTSTRAEAGEWSERGVRLCHDGPDLVWWFDPIVQPRNDAEAAEWCRAGRIRSTSDGPYSADHMQEKTIGRVVGIATGSVASSWAREYCEKHDREVDMRAQKAAQNFDPELYIQLFDRIGHVLVVCDSPGSTGILGSLTRECDHDERCRIYTEYAAVFAAHREGLGHSDRKLEAALRNYGRVITWSDGEWRVDRRMPDHVRAVHMQKDA